MPRINRNNAVGLVLGHGIPPRAVYSTQAQGVNSNYFENSTAKRGRTHMGKLQFHARGAVYEAAAGVARKLGLDDVTAERLLATMLDAVTPGSAARYQSGEMVEVIVPPGGDIRTAVPAGSLTAGWAAGVPIATLGPQHGTVLATGDKVPNTWFIAYRDSAGVVRNKETGERADWATVWWELP